ncbi:MAG: hypothetical protein ACOCW2_01870, partial [Chitinivibrionales bacterium]
MLFFLTVILHIMFVAVHGEVGAQENQGIIAIEWTNRLSGDFSFRRQWSYPEGVYRNRFGQLSCDGLCPDEAYALIDSTGKVNPDSIDRFYRIIDTAHQVHSF